jgi:hypothetical protein
LLEGLRDPSADITPFDLSTDRYFKYPTANPAAALDALVETLQATLRGAPWRGEPAHCHARIIAMCGDLRRGEHQFPRHGEQLA